MLPPSSNDDQQQLEREQQSSSATNQLRQQQQGTAAYSLTPTQNNTTAQMPTQNTQGATTSSLTLTPNFLTPTQNTHTARRAELIPLHYDMVTDALTHFVTGFQERYGALHPQFHRGTLQDAAVDSLGSPDGQQTRTRQPLVLYLHNDNDRRADLFAKVICSTTISQLLNANFVVWPWDLTFSANRKTLLDWLEVLHMHSPLQAMQTVAPRDAVILVLHGKNNRCIERTSKICGDGITDLAFLQRRLSVALQLQDRLMEKWESERRENSERDQLRQKQHEEYAKAKAIDSAKFAELRKERERKHELERQQAEDEQRREAERRLLAELLPSEPAQNDDPNGGGVFTIRLRTPDGHFLPERRFRADDDARALFWYATVQGYDEQRYSMWAREMPMREIRLNPSTKTFTDLGWNAHRALVIIQVKART